MSFQNVKKQVGLLLALFLTLSLVLPTLVTASPTHVIEVDDTPQAETEATNASHRLIVQLKSPSLSEWSRTNAAARTLSGQLNLQAPSAQAHLAQLQSEQAAFVDAMAKALPEASVAAYINEKGQSIAATYQIVFNGVAVDAGTADVEATRQKLARIEGVLAVYYDYAHEPQMYASLPLINAAALWDHSDIGGQADAGAGIKVASMDGGVHHDAPMFDGTGYSYPAGFPLGDTANTNGKIIASRAYFRAWDPPAEGDENTWPGEAGTSHGVHTAGTAAGNSVIADYGGITETISGVAPAAYVMSYRMFYESVSGDGSFYTVEGIAALEDIVADGANVLNNSWGGGPSSAGGMLDPLDMALINAASSGVFVSMSAGNSGPGNGTTDHPSDDYINVAASSTDGTLAAGRLHVSAPEPVPADLEDMPFGTAEFGDSLDFGTTSTYSFVTAESVDSANYEGCDAWSGTPFTGKAAIISRGTCEFGVKVLNAENAGAEFVVIYNNVGDEVINMGGGAVGSQVTIPSIFIGNTDGLGMVDWYDDHGNASEMTLDTVAFQLGNDADIIASFSSRGPGVGNVLKPDIAAPGVNILSQGYTPGASGEARHLGYGQVSGTSMASPHVAGAAALLRQIHPGWSNAYIKSALMSTSQYMDIYNHDGSPAQPLDMGAGRLDLTNAADPGVILSPPSLSYGAIPSGTMTTLTVTVTSVATATETYDLSTLFTGDGFAPTETTSLPGFSISTNSITLDPAETEVISVTFDTSMGQGLGDNQGYIILDGDVHDAHMPAWARVLPPPAADVLLIQNDFSYLLSFPNYLSYYTDALDELGVTYDVWNAEWYFNNPVTVPDATTLSAYEAVIYFTGDNYFPNGSFTVATPPTVLDMNRLTEYANSGGIVIVMGQDASYVLNDSFFQLYVLGGGRVQDSVTGYSMPTLPVVAMPDAPLAFQDLFVDLSGPDTYVGNISLPEVWSDSVLRVFLPLVTNGPGTPLPAAPTGSALFTYDVDSGRLDYEVEVEVTDPVTVTASHIHQGSRLETGPVLYPLLTEPVYVTDTYTFSGSLLVDPADVGALLDDETYINIHTSEQPSGAVRSQVSLVPYNDGANNQAFIDEFWPPAGEPDGMADVPPQYTSLLQYPGQDAALEGLVAIAHRDQPTLERPGTAYYGRSIYTGFGLEGVNDWVDTTSRAQLLDTFLAWGMDEPTVVITDVTDSYADTSPLTFFSAELSSNIEGTTGVSYRWDFGDGSDYAGPYTSSMASHEYGSCGTYTVRVEATDVWGNRVIGTQEVTVVNCPPPS